MKKVYLLLTAICLAALTGCIKEEYTLEETAITVNVSTRSTGTESTEQGDGIQDVNVWAFKYTVNEDNIWTVTDTATAWSRVPAMAAWSSVDVHLQFKACNDTEKYILVAVINQGQFGTIKVDSETITLGRNTTYSQLTNAKFVAPNELMGSNPGNGSGADPDYMPISHWKTFELTADDTGKTHPSTCLEVPMPVYRALAKTQLLVAKSDENSTVTIKNVTLGAGSMGTDGTIISTNVYPTEGALLSAAVGQVVTVNNTTKAADFVAPGDTTPQWYVSDVTKSTAAVTKDILTAESVTIGNDYVLTEQEHNSNTVENFGDYQYITSYFLYENKGGSNVWNTASTNGGYYMAVTYDAGAGDKTERVWLPAVVRNHDIQVRALVNAGGKMTLTINVLDWQVQPNHWDFTDVVHVADGGQLKWITGTEYDTNVNLDGEGGTTGKVECEFHIIAPTGGTWVASLIGGDVNDFAFKVGDDQLLPIVEGEISVEASAEATLTIVPKNPTVASEKRVTLDIAVRTSDGRTIDASVVYGDAPRTIIQQATRQ